MEEIEDKLIHKIYLCSVCGIYYNKKQKQKHIDSKFHKSRLKAIKIYQTCQICRKRYNIHHLYAHEKSKIHKKAISLMQCDPDTTEIDFSIYETN